MSSSLDYNIRKVKKYMGRLKDKERAGLALHQLGKMDMSPQLLCSTGVGMAVNELSQHNVHGKAASRIVERWKEMIFQGSASISQQNGSSSSDDDDDSHHSYGNDNRGRVNPIQGIKNRKRSTSPSPPPSRKYIGTTVKEEQHSPKGAIHKEVKSSRPVSQDTFSNNNTISEENRIDSVTWRGRLQEEKPFSPPKFYPQSNTKTGLNVAQTKPKTVFSTDKEPLDRISVHGSVSQAAKRTSMVSPSPHRKNDVKEEFSSPTSKSKDESKISSTVFNNSEIGSSIKSRKRSRSPSPPSSRKNTGTTVTEERSSPNTDIHTKEKSSNARQNLQNGLSNNKIREENRIDNFPCRGGAELQQDKPSFPPKLYHQSNTTTGLNVAKAKPKTAFSTDKEHKNRTSVHGSFLQGAMRTSMTSSSPHLKNDVKGELSFPRSNNKPELRENKSFSPAKSCHQSNIKNEPEVAETKKKSVIPTENQHQNITSVHGSVSRWSKRSSMACFTLLRKNKAKVAKEASKISSTVFNNSGNGSTIKSRKRSRSPSPPPSRKIAEIIVEQEYFTDNTGVKMQEKSSVQQQRLQNGNSANYRIPKRTKRSTSTLPHPNRNNCIQSQMELSPLTEKRSSGVEKVQNYRASDMTHHKVSALETPTSLCPLISFVPHNDKSQPKIVNIREKKSVFCKEEEIRGMSDKERVHKHRDSLSEPYERSSSEAAQSLFASEFSVQSSFKFQPNLIENMGKESALSMEEWKSGTSRKRSKSPSSAPPLKSPKFAEMTQASTFSTSSESTPTGNGSGPNTSKIAPSVRPQRPYAPRKSPRPEEDNDASSTSSSSTSSSSSGSPPNFPNVIKKEDDEFSRMLATADVAVEKPKKLNVGDWLNDIDFDYHPMPIFASAKPESPEQADDAIDPEMMFKPKNQKYKVYSGRKKTIVPTEAPTLFSQCIRVACNNVKTVLNTLESVPISFDVLRPVLEKCTAEQLLLAESRLPYLVEETDIIWKRIFKCAFPCDHPNEEEFYRDAYKRLTQETEERLRVLNEKIKGTMKHRRREVIIAEQRALVEAKKQMKLNDGRKAVTPVKTNGFEPCSSNSKAMSVIYPNSFGATLSGEKKPVPKKKIGELMLKTMKMCNRKRL